MITQSEIISHSMVISQTVSPSKVVKLGNGRVFLNNWTVRIYYVETECFFTKTDYVLFCNIDIIGLLSQTR